jgi:O-antigen ligase
MARRDSYVIPFRSGRALRAPAMPAATMVAPAPAAAAAVRTDAAVHEVTPAAKWATAGAVFLAISKFHGYIGILATIRAPMLMSVLALTLLFMDTKSWRPADLKRHWIPKVLAVFIVIAIGSIPFGIYQGQSLDTFTDVLGKTLLIALMVWAVARTERGTLFMMRTLTISIIAASVLALKMGRVDNTGRLAGGYSYDPNDISLLAVTGLPLVVWWALDQRNKFGKLILLSLPVLFKVIFASMSRGAFIGLLAMTAGFILMGLGPVSKKVKRVALGAGLAVVLAMPFFPSKYLEQMKTITSDDDYNQKSLTGRKEVWKRGFGYAKDHPLFGVGLGNFNSAEGRSDVSVERSAARKGFKWGTAHNSYVQVLAELGFIGGACFVTLIFGSIITLVLLHRRGMHNDMLPPLFAISMTGFAGAAAFLSWGYYDLPYVMMALACAMLLRARYGEAAPVPLPAPAATNGRVRR